MQVRRLLSGAAVSGITGLNWMSMSVETEMAGILWFPRQWGGTLCKALGDTAGFCKQYKGLYDCVNTSGVIMKKEFLPENYQVFSEIVSCRDWELRGKMLFLFVEFHLILCSAYYSVTWLCVIKLHKKQQTKCDLKDFWNSSIVKTYPCNSKCLLRLRFKILLAYWRFIIR